MTRAESIMEKIAVTPDLIMGAVAKRVGQYSQRAKTIMDAGIAMAKGMTGEAADFAKNLSVGTSEHAATRLGLSTIQTLLPRADKVNPAIRKFIGKKLDVAADMGMEATGLAGKVKPRGTYPDMERPGLLKGETFNSPSYQARLVEHKVTRGKALVAFERQNKAHDQSLTSMFDTLNTSLTKLRK
jgi:hypothetical protein